MANVDLSGLRDAILKIAQEKAKNAASRIADELTNEARSAIDVFYASYSPVMYKHRQGGLKDTFKRYYKNPHSIIYHGGVEFMPGSGSYHSSLSGEPVGADFISALSVFNGEHGNVQAFPFAVKTIPPVMSPSPYEIVEQKRNEILMNIYDYIN